MLQVHSEAIEELKERLRKNKKWVIEQSIKNKKEYTNKVNSQKAKEIRTDYEAATAPRAESQLCMASQQSDLINQSSGAGFVSDLSRLT